MTDKASPVENDKHLHQRVTESTTRSHIRRFDGGLAQVVKLGAALAVLAMAVGAGYLLRDRIRTVDDLPAQWADHLEDELAQWKAINTNMQSNTDMNAQFDFVLFVLAEMRCTLNANDVAARNRCRDEETERRLEEMRQRRKTP